MKRGRIFLEGAATLAVGLVLAGVAYLAYAEPGVQLEVGAKLYYQEPPRCCPAPAIVRVNTTQDSRVWYAVGAFHADSGFIWDRRDTIFLAYKDGRRIFALEQFAKSNPERGTIGMVPLEGHISSDMVERVRALVVKKHHGQVGTVLYVGFPPGTDARGADVRYGRRGSH